MKITNNKPDIVVIDNMRKEIIIIEVGITNRDSLNKTEVQKKRKYNLLVNELKRMYKYNVNIVPIVFSWDGLVTRYFKKYTESIELDNNTIGYMQGNVIKDTLEIISKGRKEKKEGQ